MCHSEKAPLRAVSFGYNRCLSPGESHRASLGSSCHIFRLKRKPPSCIFPLPPKKENLESWSLKNLGQVFNELRRPCLGGLEMAAVTLGLAPLVTP